MQCGLRLRYTFYLLYLYQNIAHLQASTTRNYSSLTEYKIANLLSLGLLIKVNSAFRVSSRIFELVTDLIR